MLQDLGKLPIPMKDLEEVGLSLAMSPNRCSYGTVFHATTASQRYRRAIFTTLPMLAGRQSAAAVADKVGWRDSC